MKNELFTKILRNVSKTVEGRLPRELPIGDRSEGNSLTAKEFFDNLNTLFEKNGVYSLAPLNHDSDDYIRRNLSRATTYTVKVMNSLLMTSLFKESIDAYFGDPRNSSTFSQYSNEEKESLKSELKEYIEDTLDVGADTLGGKEFVNELRSGFTVNSYINGMNCIYNCNSFLDNNREIGGLTDNNYPAFAPISNSFTQRIQRQIVSCIENNADDLASEDDWSIKKDALEFIVNYRDGENEINPKDFVDHFNNSTLSQEEKIWAAKIYGDLLLWGDNSLEIGFEDIKIDGKPLINGTEDILQKGQHLLMSEVVARLLSGEKVTALDRNNNEYLLSANISVEKTVPEKEKKWYDFFVELIEGMLQKMGITTKAGLKKQKEQQIEEMIAKNEQNRQEYIDKIDEYNENDVRRKIKFEELSGKSDIVKASNYSETNMQKSKSNGRSK